MNKKIAVMALAILTLIFIHSSEAQQSAKVHRIGYLTSTSASADKPRGDALRRGLRELGYVEGKNITIESRYAEGKLDRLLELAAELVRFNVEVIVAGGGSSVRGAKKASEMIPIVMTNVSDPVDLKFVASLAKPGGSITGLTTQGPELGGKRLELLKEIVPKLSRVAVLSAQGSISFGVQMKEIEPAARTLSLQLQTVNVTGADDLESAFSAITKERTGALLGLQNPTLSFLRRRIAELAAKSRLPSVFPDTEYPGVGGLMAYGPDYADLSRRAAAYVDKILKGAKPGDLPVEGPTKFELIINLKTAQQIGVTIPQSVLNRADMVIK